MTHMMIPKRVVIVAALVAASAQAKSKDEKLCADLADFRAGVTDLQQMGSQSTLGELRQKESQLYATEKRVARRAKHDKHARDLHNAIEDLNKTVNRLPADSTVASAQSAIDAKVSAVASAADSFSQTYCPAGK